MSLELYRYHNPAKCDSQDTQRCFKGPVENPRGQKNLSKPCPIWVRGNTPDGTYVRQSLKKLLGNSTRDWSEAVEAVRQWEQTGRTPEPKVETRTAITDLHQKFIINMKTENKGTETIRKMEYLFKLLEDFAAEQKIKHVDELNRTQVEAFRNSWTQGPLFRQKQYQRLRAVCKYATAHGMIAANPTADLKGIKVKNGDTIKDWDEKQVLAILIAAKHDSDKRVYPLVLLMRYTGLRISDACMLHERAIKGNQITVRTIKTDKEVSVTVPAVVSEALKAIRREHDGYFFWNGKSTLASLTDLWRDHHLRRVFDAAKVDGTPHMFRHTLVHSLLNDGMSMREVAAVIGDTVRITEMHYGKWNTREQERLNQRIVEAHESDTVLAALMKAPAAVVSIAKRAG